MARSFLVPINLNQLELQNARVQNLSTTQINAIGSPVSGQVAYDNVLNTLKVYNGTGWTPVGSVQTGSGAPASTPTSSGGLFLDLTNLVLYVAKGTSSAADWVPVLPYGLTADMANLSNANAEGTSLKVSRADHVHRHTDDDHGSIHLNALATATGEYSMGGHKITSVALPTNGTDAANKNYVDAAVTGLNVHDHVEVATDGNLTDWTYAAGTLGADGGTGVGATLTSDVTGTTVIDGYTLLLNDRVLVKDQTTKTENGIYYVTTVGETGVATVLTRTEDADNSLPGDVTAGDFIFVVSGGQQSTGWTQTNSGTSTNPAKGIKIGTDDIEFSQFSGAGTYTASDGVLLTGTNFTFAPSTTGGLTTGVGGGAVLLPATSGLITDGDGLALNPTADGGLTTSTDGSYILLNTTSGLTTTNDGLAVAPGLGITISGAGDAGAATTNQVAINTNVVARKYTTTIGNASSTTFTVTHNLNTRFVNVTIFDSSTYETVYADVANSTANTVTISFAVAPSNNAYSVLVVG